MYNPRDIIDVIADNCRKTRNPFSVPKTLVNRWWRKAGLRNKGENLLFTGLMYQFLPYIDKLTRYLEAYEDSRWARYTGYARYVPKLPAGVGLALVTSPKEKRKANAILENIATVLGKSNVDFYYRPDLDDYSGILLYDLGDQDGFVAHARYVASKLKREGVQNLITVDPHTTYAMKVLYPKYVGVSFDVKTYFEYVHLQSRNGHQRVTLHDPCFYGRYLELSDVPTRVLQSLGIECVGVESSGRFTNCCGGPAESISPSLSRQVLERRVEELQTTGAPIITMCPICLSNLRKTGADVRDLSTLLAQCAGE